MHAKRPNGSESMLKTRSYSHSDPLRSTSISSGASIGSI